MNLRTLLGDGVPLRWPHRVWLGAIFVIGVMYCYAFPPFQTNDEDAHWKHMWGVAYGHAGCRAPKPRAVIDFLGIVQQRAVRENPGDWRVQYQREALHFVGSDEKTTNEGTACRYPPHPYVVPGLVARLVAFGVRGKLAAGSVLRAAYAARITNWILVTLAILLLCRRLPWMRNFALAFYSIPEVIQQSMAVNTDAFLFVAAAVLLLLVFGSRLSPWSLVLVGLLVGLMTIVRPVYAPLCALGFIAADRLLARRGRRWIDLAALAGALALPFVIQWLWMRWLATDTAAPGPDRGSNRAAEQLAFLHAHHGIVWTLLVHQWRDFFGTDLMKGSWLSIFGAFGWSMFTMRRAAYYLLLVAFGCALGADLIAAAPMRGLEPPTRRTKVALALVAAAIFVVVVGIIIGMYVYFSGAFLGRIGADEVIGVQGRYYLVPILFWTAFVLYVARRHQPLPRYWAGLPDALTTASLLLCTWANVHALREILYRFNSVYLPYPIPAPPHY